MGGGTPEKEAARQCEQWLCSNGYFVSSQVMRTDRQIVQDVPIRGRRTGAKGSGSRASLNCSEFHCR